MKYFLIIVALIIIVFAVVCFRISFLTAARRKEILKFAGGLYDFELFFLLLAGVDRLGERIHLKYLGNVVSFVSGLLLVLGGVLLIAIAVQSF